METIAFFRKFKILFKFWDPESLKAIAIFKKFKIPNFGYKNFKRYSILIQIDKFKFGNKNF